MKTLPLNIILEKNKLATPNPWLIALEITFLDSTVERIVNNTEDVVYGGNTYTKFPFSLDVISQDTNSSIPTVVLKISNVMRAFQAYLEAQQGCVGAKVVIRVLNAGHLGEDFSELEMEFEVLESNADANWLTFTLGAPNPLRSDFPRELYIASHCNWVRNYKGAECKYGGPETTCDGTLDTCRTRGNAYNFGGFPGLGGGGIKLA
jgi:lambda family phage minor tail protein L